MQSEKIASNVKLQNHLGLLFYENSSEITIKQNNLNYTPQIGWWRNGASAAAAPWVLKANPQSASCVGLGFVPWQQGVEPPIE